jgi:integrase
MPPRARRKQLTMEEVLAAPSPEKGCRYLMDPSLPGFGVRIYPKSRVWVFQRKTIGDVTAWPISLARQEAQHLARRGDVARRANFDSLFVEKARQVLDDFVFERIWRLAQEEFLTATRGEEVAADLASRTLDDLFGVLQRDHYPTRKTGQEIIRVWKKNILDFKVEIPGSGKLRLGSARLRQLQRTHFEELVKRLKDKPQLANKALRILHAAFETALSFAPPWLSKNPVDRIRRYPSHPRTRALLEEEFPAFFKGLEQVREEKRGRGEPYLSVIEFNVLAGCRPGEPRSFLWEDLRIEVEIRERRSIVSFQAFEELKGSGARFELTAGGVQIPTSKTDKDGKPLGRFVPFGPRALSVVLRQPRVSRYIFADPRDSSRPFSYSTFSRWWRRVRAKAELSADVVPYTARHTAASHHEDAGVSLSAVADHLGHADVQTTVENYRHIQPKGRLRTAAQLEGHLVGLVERRWTGGEEVPESA